MKRKCFNRISSLLALFVLGGISGCPSAKAQEMELETLVVFAGTNGSYPESISQAPDGSMYGETYSGGAHDKGTLFKISLNEEMTTLYDFDGTNGAFPIAGLTIGADNNYYGTTSAGGDGDRGTVFKLTPDGKVTTLAVFNGANGAHPKARLLATHGGAVYGCTENGGDNDQGTLFVITKEGEFKTLTHFNGANGAHPLCITPGPLDEQVYGTTSTGGANGKGTIFHLTTSGKIETLHSFHETDGSAPDSLKIDDAGFFVGTTQTGGQYGKGTLFTLESDGLLSTVTNFNDSVGSNPTSSLIRWSDGYFYMATLSSNLRIKSSISQWLGPAYCGTTSNGGAHGKGTVYRVSLDGKMQTLVSFSGTDGRNQGAAPTWLMSGRDGDLYGTAETGGANNKGTIFRVIVKDSILPAGSEYASSASPGKLMLPPIVSP